VRQQVDADTKGAQLRSPFKDGRAEAAGVQRQRGGKPADAATGDQYLSHRVSLPSTSIVGGDFL
jgi:hypothetical protein